MVKVSTTIETQQQQQQKITPVWDSRSLRCNLFGVSVLWILPYLCCRWWAPQQMFLSLAHRSGDAHPAPPPALILSPAGDRKEDHSHSEILTAAQKHLTVKPTPLLCWLYNILRRLRAWPVLIVGLHGCISSKGSMDTLTFESEWWLWTVGQTDSL